MAKKAKKASGPKLEFVGPKLKKGDLVYFEMTLSRGPLPGAWLSFLLKHNGGTPRPGLFDWQHPIDGPRTSHFDTLLGLDPRPFNDPARNADAVSVTLSTRDDLPPGCLAIGFANRDDLVLLFTAGEREGQVWIKDWQEVDRAFPNAIPPDEAVYFVAESFDAFLAMIHEEDDPYRPVHFALDGPAVRGKRLAATLETMGMTPFKYEGVASHHALPPMWEWPRYRRSGGEHPATVEVEKNHTFGHAAKIDSRKKGHPILVVNASSDDRDACVAELAKALGDAAVRL